MIVVVNLGKFFFCKPVLTNKGPMYKRMVLADKTKCLHYFAADVESKENLREGILGRCQTWFSCKSFRARTTKLLTVNGLSFWPVSYFFVVFYSSC